MSMTGEKIKKEFRSRRENRKNLGKKYRNFPAGRSGEKRENGKGE